MVLMNNSKTFQHNFLYIQAKIVFRFGVRDPNYKEFTLGKSYVFAAGVLTTARPWDVSPQTTSARIAFLR